MKKALIIICSILAICFAIPKVYASSKKVLITYTGSTSLRSGPATTYPEIAKMSMGQSYYLAEETVTPNGGCSFGWYKIIYNSTTTGYVCGTLVSLITVSDSDTPTTSCETEMSNLGFPSSYWGGLCELKKKHPNWVFHPIQTGLDWTTVVNEESACGTSYIASSNSEYIDSSCKNAYTNTWYPASKKAVAYYMDPRNWFDEKYMFQFQYLKYDTAVANYYPTGVRAILQNAAFYTYHANLGNDLSTITTTAGANTNVSPIFLASRMLQELGSGTSLVNLYNGSYGVYNFFNFGVADSCATSSGASNCGIAYAEQRGWTTPLLAIQGASSILSSSYINVGQYTTYLQKYNVVPTNASSRYIHQYMTNIAAPSSEAKTTYSSYNSLGIIDIGFSFYIPVYNNMDTNISNSDSGATDGGSTSASTMDISSIVTSSGYKYSSGTLSGINLGTDVSTVISSLNAISGTNTTVKNTSGTVVTSGKIGTGYQVTITNSSKSETLTVVVKGDTSGDGVVNALDLLQVQKQILGTYKLSGAYLKAADTSGDGKVDALDLLQVQKQILGTYTISQ